MAATGLEGDWQGMGGIARRDKAAARGARGRGLLGLSELGTRGGGGLLRTGTPAAPSPVSLARGAVGARGAARRRGR